MIEEKLEKEKNNVRYEWRQTRGPQVNLTNNNTLTPSFVPEQIGTYEFEITANDYWHYHYRFDEPAAFKKKNTGASMISNILINTICPALFAWGHYHQDDHFKTKAIHWLENLLPDAR